MQTPKKSSANKQEEANDAKKKLPLNIVAIGASAGGLEALQVFLAKLPEISNTALIVAQHLSPSHKSLLVQLLAKATNMKVVEADHGSKLLSSRIYITPPDKEITITDGIIHLSKPPSKIGPKPSIDKLFQSLSNYSHGKVVGVILSGTGSDGALGVSALKAGGTAFTLVQEPTSAKYSGMPVAAIQTGNADLVLPPDKMGDAILQYLLYQTIIKHNERIVGVEPVGIHKILEYLTIKTGADFSKYKPATIKRRLIKRMQQLDITSLEDYIDLLENSGEESDIMFKMILIGVTSFFRDKEAFAQMKERLQQIVEAKKPGDTIRIWVPGCSSGEEPYSFALLLDELLGEKRVTINVQIFATDIDERAIASGRKGIYSEAALEFLMPEMKARYFQRKGTNYELAKGIRTMVLFSRHDITKNPPFLKLDLISCRNLLIYFSTSLQQLVIPLFHYALHQDGILFLGKSETIGQYTDLFEAIDSKNKIYQRKRGGTLHVVKFSAYRPQRQLLPQPSLSAGIKEFSIPDMVKETLYNTFESPYIVINEAFDIQEINGDLSAYLSLPQGAIQVNLLKMIHSELYITVRSVIIKAIKGNESMISNVRSFVVRGEKLHIKIKVKPLLYSEKSSNLYLVVFEKMEPELLGTVLTSAQEVQVDNLRIVELESELVATKEHLQTYIEELETSNEELQSLNEEMQSTNEELQSSNEELETTNEELQSTNEEMQVAYSELKTIKEELESQEQQLKTNEANIRALLNNNLQSFLLIDTTYKIVAFNNKAYQTFFELRNKKLSLSESIIDVVEPGELQNFILDFSRAVSGEMQSIEKQYTDFSGNHRWFLLNLTPVQFDQGNPRGISLSMMEMTDLKRAVAELKSSEGMLHSVFDATSVGICITNEHGKYVRVNKKYCEMYGYAMRDLIGHSFLKVVPKENHIDAQAAHDKFIETGIEIPAEWTMVKKDGTTMTVFETAELMKNEFNERYKVTSVTDITEKIQSEQRIAASEKSYRLLFEENPIPSFMVDVDNEEVLVFNRAAAINYGFTATDWSGIPFQSIVVGEKLDLKKLAAENADNDLKRRYQMQHKSKHGKLLEVEVFGHSIVYLNKECMLLICNDVSDRKEIEVKITKAIIQAQEEERFQMGAELHDNICQLLAYAQMNMGMMKKDIGQMGGKWFEQASGSVQEALESVRSVSHQLAPAFLRDRPLKDAMLMLLEGFTSSGKLTFSYDYDERLNELNFDLDRKLNLYRILQEQLRNIDKHSGATSVAISLQIAQGELQMRIMDNGHGFDKALVFSGIGFANIKRRAELFGGAFQVESTPGNGCEIFVSMKIS